MRIQHFRGAEELPQFGSPQTQQLCLFCCPSEAETLGSASHTLNVVSSENLLFSVGFHCLNPQGKRDAPRTSAVIPLHATVRNTQQGFCFTLSSGFTENHISQLFSLFRKALGFSMKLPKSRELLPRLCILKGKGKHIPICNRM